MHGRQTKRVCNQLLWRAWPIRGGANAQSSSLTSLSPLEAAGARSMATAPSSAGSNLTRARILFLGAPGAGKGTYAKVLFEKYRIPHISSGDIIRHHIKTGTVIGRKMEETVRQGKLVSDEVVLSLIEERLFQSEDTRRGDVFLLDGFPRNTFQAEAFARMAQKYSQTAPSKTPFSAFDIVLNLLIREDILVQKVVKRRVCETCGRNYNLANIIEPQNNIYMPPLLPKVEGICDDDGGKLIQRPDDVEATVRDRLQVYSEQTQPLIDFYKKNKNVMFMDFDVSQGKDRSSPRLIEMFSKFLSR